MPYVPSVKTDGKSTDRVLIDEQVEFAAKAVTAYRGNFGILRGYKWLFETLGRDLTALSEKSPYGTVMPLAETIFNLGAGYGYDGAFLGELNYAITRVIQRVPQLMVASGQWKEKDELRYWLYAVTVQALIYASNGFADNEYGIGGVFVDIKDEYKRRVNTAYEAAQIVKSGDCFDTPYYTRLIELVDGETGKVIGHQEVMLKRSPETVGQDVLPYRVFVSQPVVAA
jgi:hypothetical protein